MDDALAALVVGVGEKDIPALGQRAGVHGEPVVLRGDVAAARALVDAWLVVTAVPIPTMETTLHYIVLYCA